jgi:hypothetical protein
MLHRQCFAAQCCVCLAHYPACTCSLIVSVPCTKCMHAHDRHRQPPTALPLVATCTCITHPMPPYATHSHRSSRGAQQRTSVTAKMGACFPLLQDTRALRQLTLCCWVDWVGHVLITLHDATCGDGTLQEQQTAQHIGAHIRRSCCGDAGGSLTVSHNIRSSVASYAFHFAVCLCRTAVPAPCALQHT